MTLANIITSLRIAFIPVYAFAAYTWLGSGEGETWWWVAFPLFVLLSASDMIDGAVARWRDERTVLGAWLDPTADKLLMMASLLVLAPAKIPLWFLIVWFARELTMLGGATLMRTRIDAIRIQPRLLSKAATFLQFLVVGAAFLPIPPAPRLGVAVLAALATVGSGLLYMLDGFKQVYGPEWGPNIGKRA